MSRLLVCMFILFAGGRTPLSASPNPPQLEEDGVFVRDPEGAGNSPASSLVRQGEVPHRHSSGSWFLSAGTGTAFPQYDRGEVVNDNTGAVVPTGGSISFAVNSALSFGYRWFDPARWGHWSFDADLFGSYLGLAVSGPAGRDQDNLGFLGIRGRVGYRFWKDRLEPFVGIVGGSVIANPESGGVNHGAVWGYWFSPTGGIRYYIPNTRWSIALDGFFRFIGGLDGLSGPGVTINETPHAGLSGGWLYEPVGIVSIGYRF